MPDRYFEDYQVGEGWRSHGRTVTEADIVNFAGVSGDFHPASMDVEFAKGTAFGRPVAHGLLTFSIVVGLSWQMKMNTKNFTYGFDHLRFLRPVFAQDTIYVNGTVIETGDYGKRPELGVVVMKYEAYNQSDDLVFVCHHRMLVARREASTSSDQGVSRVGEVVRPIK